MPDTHCAITGWVLGFGFRARLTSNQVGVNCLVQGSQLGIGQKTKWDNATAAVAAAAAAVAVNFMVSVHM